MNFYIKPMFLSFFFVSLVLVSCTRQKARTPKLVGIQASYGSGTNVTRLDELDAYCGKFLPSVTTHPTGSHRTFYITLEHPPFVDFFASYNGKYAEHMDSVPDMRGANKDGDGIYYIMEAEELGDPDDGLVARTYNFRMGAQSSATGVFQFWTSSWDSDLSGTDAVSLSLAIPVTDLAEVKTFEMENQGVRGSLYFEKSSHVVTWDVENVEFVMISGDGFDPAEKLPNRGSRVITFSDVPVGFGFVRRQFRLTGYVKEGCSETVEETFYKVVFAAGTREFPFVLDCPPVGVADQSCTMHRVIARTEEEARLFLPIIGESGAVCEWKVGFC